MTVVGTLLLLALFADEEQAGHLLVEFEGHRSDAACGIVDAATLCKDEASVLRVTHAWYRDGRGMFVGGIIATFLSGLAGPVMAATAGGRVLGALRGRLHSAPLKFELLTVGEQLPLGSSLMVVVVEPGAGDRLSSELRVAAETVLTYDLRPPVVDQFDHGGNVAFLFPPDGELNAGAGSVAAGGGRGHVCGPLRAEDAIIISAATLCDEMLPPARRSVGAPEVSRTRRAPGPAAGSTGR